MLDFISEMDIYGKRVIDIGSGSGILSVFAALNGAIVTAVDISQAAINNTLQNAKENSVEVSAFKSDLLAEIPLEARFDFALINPPYYARNPESTSDHQWYCGENFEYFHDLFGQLKYRDIGKIYMILSQDCEVERIMHIAGENNFEFKQLLETRNKLERNFVFEIRKVSK